MLSKHHHIKAMTMLELLIVLAVSSVVFAAAGKCYEMVFRQTSTVKKAVDQVEEVHQLYYILGRDVFRASQIIKQDDRNLLFLNDSLPVSYRFDSSTIIRKLAEHTDTFHIATTDLQMEVMEAHQEVGLVDRIHFSGMLFEKKENFVFKKTYSAQALLNLSPQESK